MPQCLDPLRVKTPHEGASGLCHHLHMWAMKLGAAQSRVLSGVVPLLVPCQECMWSACLQETRNCMRDGGIWAWCPSRRVRCCPWSLTNLLWLHVVMTISGRVWILLSFECSPALQEVDFIISVRSAISPSMAA